MNKFEQVSNDDHQMSLVRYMYSEVYCFMGNGRIEVSKEVVTLIESIVTCHGLSLLELHSGE